MNPRYPAVANRAGFRCEYCHAPEQVFNFAFEVEHIEPRSLGGTDSLGNLALACESCNLFKSDATTGWDAVEGRQVSLFHPRQERWKEHFAFDSEAATLQGVTATGRVTIGRLKMNSSFQIRARRRWMELRLYP